MICGTSYTCGARPTCFMMFCALRRRLCLVRVHSGLTIFFLLLPCCIELRTSCGGCTMRLRQTTRMHHPEPPSRAEPRRQRHRRHRRPRVCCAGSCGGCPAAAPSGSASGSASNTPVRGSAVSPSRRQQPRSIKPAAATSSLFRETGIHHLKCCRY